MIRERWGTFSIKDHLRPNAFVADVLLYNKLAIPYPPDKKEEEKWINEQWHPEVLDEKREILRRAQLLVDVPWNDRVKSMYASRFAMADDINEGAKTIDLDPWMVSRIAIAKDFLPKKTVSGKKIWPMIAYPAMKNYEEDEEQKSQEEKQSELLMVLSNRFLVPEDDSKSGNELLLEAIRLTESTGFANKREELFKWQEEMIEMGITPQEAVDDLEEKLKQYNEVLKKGRWKMVYKYAFLAIEVALGIAGAKFGEPIATSAAVAGITKFAMLDSKIDIDAGDCKAAIMIHDFEKKFK